MKRTILNTFLLVVSLFLVLNLSPSAGAQSIDATDVSVDNTPADRTVVTVGSSADAVLKALAAQGQTARLSVPTGFTPGEAVYVLLNDTQIVADAWVEKNGEDYVRFDVPQAGTYVILQGDPPTVTVDDPTIELSQTGYSYDGTAKTPTVIVKHGSAVIPASEYTVSYSGNTNAGTATVTITDVDGGSYTVSGSTTFAISPIRLSWDISGLSATKPEGETGEAAVTGTLKLAGILNNEVTFTHGDLVTSGFSATKPGSYPGVKVVPKSGGWNFPASPNYTYPSADPIITATVTKVVREYSVKIPAVKNGSITASDTTVESGTTVTITAAPRSGYKLKSLTVVDAAGKALKLTSRGDGKHTFTMPESDVTVTGRFTRRVFSWWENPSTGDYIMIAVAVMVLSAAALAVLLIVRKKKKQ